MLKFLSILPTPWTRRLIQQVGLMRNPYTLGVRVIVEDDRDRVLLVRHSYLNGWYLPGSARGGRHSRRRGAAAAQRLSERTGDRTRSCRPVSPFNLVPDGEFPGAEFRNRRSRLFQARRASRRSHRGHVPAARGVSSRAVFVWALVAGGRCKPCAFAVGFEGTGDVLTQYRMPSRP